MWSAGMMAGKRLTRLSVRVWQARRGDDPCKRPLEPIWVDKPVAVAWMEEKEDEGG
jgi:hypothetical protein